MQKNAQKWAKNTQFETPAGVTQKWPYRRTNIRQIFRVFSGITQVHQGGTPWPRPPPP